jgi:hypothetical protein
MCVLRTTAGAQHFLFVFEFSSLPVGNKILKEESKEIIKETEKNSKRKRNANHDAREAHCFSTTGPVYMTKLLSRFFEECFETVDH